MLKKYLLLATALSFTTFLIQPAMGNVIFNQTKAISINNEIKHWAKQIKTNAINELIQLKNDTDGYTQCLTTKENLQVILCASYLQRDMNAFLLRPTIFAEGGIGNHKKGELISTQDPSISAHLDVIGGHDLTSEELSQFYSKAKQRCALGQKDYCLTDREHYFYQQVIQPLETRSQSFVLISFSIQSTSTPEQIVSHEFVHALYFLNSHYRERIRSFWQSQMTQAQRDAIKSKLNTIGYNAADNALMENEFQAYMLMQHAEESILEEFLPQYREKLKRYLASGDNASHFY